MRTKSKWPEGTEVVKDIAGQKWRVLPNGIAQGKNGYFNVAKEKVAFMETMGYYAYNMYEANTVIWHREDDGTASWSIRHCLEVFAVGLAASGRHFVRQEWLDEILANKTPLENIDRYLDVNEG